MTQPFSISEERGPQGPFGHPVHAEGDRAEDADEPADGLPPAVLCPGPHAATEVLQPGTEPKGRQPQVAGQPQGPDHDAPGRHGWTGRVQDPRTLHAPRGPGWTQHEATDERGRRSSCCRCRQPGKP